MCTLKPSTSTPSSMSSPPCRTGRSTVRGGAAPCTRTTPSSAVSLLLANPGLGPAKERNADVAANFEFAAVFEQRDATLVDSAFVGVQYFPGRIAVRGLLHA